MNLSKYFKIFSLAGFALMAGFSLFYFYGAPFDFTDSAGVLSPVISDEKTPEEPKITHIETPDAVKAIYMTSWVTATLKWREELADFIQDSELNSVVIDIKDYSGRVAYDTDDSLVDFVGSEEVRVKDLPEFITYLHDKGIYVIARITVFQDPYYAGKFPEYAVKTKAGELWKDHKSLMYIDPSAEEFWKYIVSLSLAAERVGFDELNFDYIRFPSDGNMRDIAYPVSGDVNKDVTYETTLANGSTTLKTVSGRTYALEKFFAYLHKELKGAGIPISADIFGMTTTNPDDLNIGQVLEGIEPYFDYLSPMVYPSHYPAGFIGLQNPAAYPYEVVKYSMEKAVERLKAASTSPFKLRPWLQDFDLGAIYDEDKIRAQKQAVYDAGLVGWMIWDPSNRYTRSAYYEKVDDTAVDKLE